jgi:outer membrane protein assembly factor BamB
MLRTLALSLALTATALTATALTATALTATALTATLAAPAHAAGPAGWDHPGFDAEDSYYNPAESAINAGTVAHLTRRWQVPLRRHAEACGGASTPLVAAGRVFATDELGISAYESRTGALAWRYNWPDPDDASTPDLAVAAGVLVAANNDCHSASDPDGTLTALETTTGHLRWQTKTGFPIFAAVVDKNMIVVSGESASDEQAAVAYRAADGHQAWRKPGFASSPVSADGRTLLTKGTTTTAVAVTTGAVLWTKPRLWQAQSATPASDRFLVTDGAALTAINAATGTVAWTAPGKAADLLATDGRRVYRAEDHTIEAVSAVNGRPLWSRQLAAETTQPVRAGGLLYTSGAVLNPTSGEMAAPGTPFAGKQIVTGGRLYTVNGTTLASYSP